MKGGTENFFLKTKEASRKKDISKWFFSRCSPSSWKRNLKYENICLIKYSSQNIWAIVYVIVFILPPHFSNFYIYYLYFILLRRNKNVSCLYRVNSSLKYILKVKLHPNIHPNILSEINSLHKNEGHGGNLVQISNWQLFIGRTQSSGLQVHTA